jgi:uncharacterized protein (DUF1330 family)
VKAYLVLDFAITDVPAFMAYVAAIPVQIARHGGRYIVQGAAPTPIEGGWAPEHMVILEFPARQNAEAFLNDPHSQELFKIRHATTLSKLVLVDGPA